MGVVDVAVSVVVGVLVEVSVVVGVVVVVVGVVVGDVVVVEDVKVHVKELPCCRYIPTTWLMAFAATVHFSLRSTV